MYSTLGNCNEQIYKELTCYITTKFHFNRQDVYSSHMTTVIICRYSKYWVSACHMVFVEAVDKFMVGLKTSSTIIFCNKKVHGLIKYFFIVDSSVREIMTTLITMDIPILWKQT